MLVVRFGVRRICPCWTKCPSYFLLYCYKSPWEMDLCVTLLWRYMQSSVLPPSHSLKTFCVIPVTDLRTVIAAVVPADVPAAVQWAGSSSVGEDTQQLSGADDPAGARGHYAWTGFLLTDNLKEHVSVKLLPLFSSHQPVWCLAVLQQGHLSFGRLCCGHADQHSTRERSWGGCCLESAAGLCLR